MSGSGGKIAISVNNKQIKISPSSGPVVRIEASKPSENASGGKLDLVFAIDTTGSMSDKIDGLLQTCERFVDELASLSLSHRIAVVAFGDLTVPGDDIVTFGFTSQVEEVKRNLNNVPRYGGGGNEGESSFEALEKAIALPFRPNVVKAIVLITDEPALRHHIAATDLLEHLRRQEILTFVVSPPEDYFQRIARQTGGVWYQVSAQTDFTDLIAMFQKLAARICSVVSDVFRVGSGSVSTYLQLKPPDR
jgi:hypothetical protein